LIWLYIISRIIQLDEAPEQNIVCFILPKIGKNAQIINLEGSLYKNIGIYQSSTGDLILIIINPSLKVVTAGNFIQVQGFYESEPEILDFYLI
jgi:hypothetical protein